MRVFLVMCFVAFATADKLGYNYQPVGHSDSGLSFSPGSSSSGGLGSGSSGGLDGLSSGSSGGLGGLGGGSLDDLGSLGGSIDSLGGGSSGGLSGINGLSGGSSGGLGSIGGSLENLGVSSHGPGDSLGSLGSSGGIDSGDYSGNSGPSSSSSVGAPGAVEYEKEFYTYTADDSAFEEPEANDQVSHSAKKNLRVIFIKGAENNALEKAAINLAKHSSEQRTAIYVLQKQASVGDLANKLQASHDVQNHQPEVHFVKYRTPEDAANAQKAIQAQYEQLGGSSQAHDGGVVPVHNFASPAAPNAPAGVDGGVSGPASGALGGNAQVGGISGGAGKGAPGATYLPAAILRTLRV